MVIAIKTKTFLLIPKTKKRLYFIEKNMDRSVQTVDNMAF